MPYHPTLSEVLDQKVGDEWIDLKINSILLREWADSGNSKGDRSNPELYLGCDAGESEYGSISFDSASLCINSTTKENIEELSGERPLGGINFYDKKVANIHIEVEEEFLKKLLLFLARDVRNLEVRVSIPQYEDKESKYLPLLSYQLTYSKEVDREFE